MNIPPRLARLVDDAAIFPPGSAPLPDAVAAHGRHRRAPYAGLVGPLVLSAAALAELPAALAEQPAMVAEQPAMSADPAVPATAAVGPLELAVTVPDPEALPAVLARVATLPDVRLVALDVALPDHLAAGDVVPAIDAALADAVVADVQVYVEVPRDARRPELLEALADSKHRAKFRTGGVEARLYPDVAELADAIARAVALRLPFKATAGLHHAIRNTDPRTGFVQHGFLNVLLGTATALRGERADAVAHVLADRDGPRVAAAFAALPDEGAGGAAATRASFVSFGSCSVTDPLTELIDLGLIPADQGAPA